MKNDGFFVRVFEIFDCIFLLSIFYDYLCYVFNLNISKSRIMFGKKIYYAMFLPLLIVLLAVFVFVIERMLGAHWSSLLGVYPRDKSTLLHIFLMPFLHFDISHLLHNMFSFLLLGTFLYYFYNDIANKILFLSVTISGLLLWCIGRESYHVGMSGLVYALVYFLFFSGLIRRFAPLVALSLVVVLLYGSNIWYLFPWQATNNLSWEGHLAGALVGTGLSIVFRKKGPQKHPKIWDEEEEDCCEPYWLDGIDEDAQS